MILSIIIGHCVSIMILFCGIGLFIPGIICSVTECNNLSINESLILLWIGIGGIILFLLIELCCCIYFFRYKKIMK